VVVLADRVPSDWPEIAANGQVYLMVGKGLSATRLTHAGLLNANAVVIHQRGPGTEDTNLADVEAIFAMRVVESLLATHNREVPILCDLTLNESAIFLPPNAAFKKKAATTNAGNAAAANSANEIMERLLKSRGLPYFIRPHYVCGQLFVSNAITCMVANLLYNPSLVKLIREFVTAEYKVIPVPADFVGRQYKAMFEHILRHENMLSIAILRRLDTIVADDEEEVEDEEFLIRRARERTNPERRWTPDEPPNRRYTFTAPMGHCRLAGDDALLCLVPPHKGPTRQELKIDNLEL